jgi:transposase InsO family protein
MDQKCCEKTSKSKNKLPFERMHTELGIKYRYIKLYKAQTNVKIERFCRTIEKKLIRETYCESIEHLKGEILQYLYYYNEERPHQSLKFQDPNKFN